MAETVEEARARIQTRAKVNFKGNALLNVSHLNYFKPLKVPDEVCKRCLVANEIITVNPLTSVVKVVGYMFLSNTPNKNLYNEYYRVWTYTTNDSQLNYIPTGKYPAIELKNIGKSDRVGLSKTTRFYSTIKYHSIASVINSSFEPLFVTSDYYSRDINNNTDTKIENVNHIDITLNNNGRKGGTLYIDVKNMSTFCGFFKYEYEFVPDTDDIVEFYESLVDGRIWSNGVDIDFEQEKFTKQLSGVSVPELVFEGWSNDTKGSSFVIPELKLYTLNSSNGYYSEYNIPNNYLNNINNYNDYFYRENNQYNRVYVKLQELKTADYNKIKVKHQYVGEVDESRPYQEASLVPTMAGWNTNPTYYLSKVVVFKGTVRFNTDTNKFIGIGEDDYNYFPYFYLYGMEKERPGHTNLRINNIDIDEVIGARTGNNYPIDHDTDVKILYGADNESVVGSENWRYTYLDSFNKYIVNIYERARTDSRYNNKYYSNELFGLNQNNNELLTFIYHVYDNIKNKLGSDIYKAWTTLGVLIQMLCTGHRLYKVKMNYDNSAVENITMAGTTYLFDLPDLYPGKFQHSPGTPLETLTINGHTDSYNENSYNISNWNKLLMPLISHIRIKINDNTVTLYSLGHFVHQYSITTPNDKYNNRIYTARSATISLNDDPGAYIAEIKGKQYDAEREGLYRFDGRNVGLYQIYDNYLFGDALHGVWLYYNNYRPIVALLSVILTQFNVYENLSFTKILEKLLPGWREFINNDKGALRRMGIHQIKFTVHYGYSGFGSYLKHKEYTFNISELNSDVARLFTHMVDLSIPPDD